MKALADYNYFVVFRFNGEVQMNGLAKDSNQTYNAPNGRLTPVSPLLPRWGPIYCGRPLQDIGMELSPQVGGLTTTPTKFTLKSSIREAPALTIMFTMPTVIAALAVYSKQLAERLASRDARWLSFMGIAMRFGGGIAIMLFGAILFMASLYGPTGSM